MILIKTINYSYYELKNEKRVKRNKIIKILKDPETQEKSFEIIDNPQYSYYISNDYLQEVKEIRKEIKNKSDRLDAIIELKDEFTPVDNIPLADCTKFTTDYSNLNLSIASNLGLDKLFYNYLSDGKFNSAKALVHLHPCVHGSDFNLEDTYIHSHYEEYPFNQNLKLTKAFFDIEVDSIDITGFPETSKAECPVNAISMFYDDNMTLYGFFLRNENNPLIQELEDNIKSFKKRIKNKYKERNLDIKLDLKWYDDEIELIGDFFDTVNYLKPDFLSAWNLTGFDIPYLIQRILNFNYDPNEFICAQDIVDSEGNNLYYHYVYIDNDKSRQDPADKGSYVACVSYTNYIDQLLLFASLRKTFGKRDSYKLDDIAYEELGENKVHFKNPDTNIKNSPYMDYEEFIEYNIHDTMLLYMIENKNKDFNMIFTVAAITETRIQKAMKKTVSIRNIAKKFYLQNGYVMSNNHNQDYDGTNPPKKVPFRGAYVANPLLNDGGFIFDWVIDFDLSSLYPSIILAFNVDSTTQIAYIKTIIDSDIPTSELAADIVSNDYINIGKKYFNLPNIEDLMKEVEKLND